MTEHRQISLVDDQIEKKYSKSVSLEHRKKFAQFFTPFTVASLMADWLLGNENLHTVLEPAFGLGVFSRTLLSKKPELIVKGFEIDEYIFSNAKNIFYGNKDIELNLEDYMFADWDAKYDGVICNPPYFKFHDYNNKLIVREVERRLKIKLTGFANLYTLFLLKSIHQIKANGRIAYLVPSEFLNSDYGKLVKSALIKSKILRHIIVIDFEEKVFDDALTTACILLCSNDRHFQKIKFSTISTLVELDAVKAYISSYPFDNDSETTYELTEIDPLIKWRKYYQKQNAGKFRNLIPFSSAAKVVRGIATGANEYFTFSKEKAEKHGIGEQYLLPCICKAVDVTRNFFTKDDFKKLVNGNRQAFLLNAVGANDINVKKYLEQGEKAGVHNKYLTACRNPWYLLENRPPAPIWVSVFNRNGLRFIRNEANISNLTTFHCVYPVKANLFDHSDVDILFAYLLTDVAREIFEDNRREYGNGLQKFEPNDINKSMMLDLSLLDSDAKIEILSLCKQYRESVLIGSPNESLVDSLNEIFLIQYSI